MMNGIGLAIEAMFITLLVTLIIFVPLGLWKLIEIIIWVFNHVHFS